MGIEGVTRCGGGGRVLDTDDDNEDNDTDADTDDVR